VRSYVPTICWLTLQGRRTGKEGRAAAVSSGGLSAHAVRRGAEPWRVSEEEFSCKHGSKPLGKPLRQSQLVVRLNDVYSFIPLSHCVPEQSPTNSTIDFICSQGMSRLPYNII